MFPLLGKISVVAGHSAIPLSNSDTGTSQDKANSLSFTGRKNWCQVYAKIYLPFSLTCINNNMPHHMHCFHKFDNFRFLHDLKMSLHFYLPAKMNYKNTFKILKLQAASCGPRSLAPILSIYSLQTQTDRNTSPYCPF